MRHLYHLFWIGVFVAIAAVGVRTIGKPESALALKDFGRDGSVNTVLEQTLNEPQAASRLTDWMSSLPSGRAILLITPPSDNMSAAITADLISYLAWPRPVIVSSDLQKTKALMANAREHYGAIGVCYLQPPPQMKISKTFGPALSFMTFEAPQAMKIAACLLAILMMLSAGMGFTAWLWRGGRAILATEWLGLGWMFGAGLVSLALALGGTVLPGSLLLPIIAIASLLLGLLGLTRWRQGFSVETGLAGAPGWEKWLSLLVLLPIFYMAYATFRDSLLWDGLVVWELKARHAFLAGGNLSAAYFADATRARFHPSYPLYLPFTELWTYLWMGDCDQTVMKLIFPLFYAAAVLLLWSGVRRLTGKVWAATATSLLPIFIPLMADHGLGLAEGYADFLLATMYLAGLAALLAWRVQGLESGWRVAMACAALLPWMKQDGLMLLVSIIAVAALVHGFAGWRRTLLFALPGIAVVLAWKLAMRAVHAVDESVFQPVTFETLSHNLPRLAPIVQAMGHQLSQLKNWSLLWFAAPVALVCLIWRQRQLGWWLFAALIFPLGLDMVPYLFTQLNLRFHIVSSFDRLALQISLVAVFCLGLALAGTATSREIPTPENKDHDITG